MKKFAIVLSDEGRVLSAAYANAHIKNAVAVDKLPDGPNLNDYIYKDGEYIYDPANEEAPIDEDYENELRQVIHTIAASVLAAKPTSKKGNKYVLTYKPSSGSIIWSEVKEGK